MYEIGLGRIYTGYNFLMFAAHIVFLTMWAEEGRDKLGILEKSSWTYKKVERAHKAC